MRLAKLFLPALLLGASPAYASPTYPGTLEAELGLSCQPVCTLCHDTMAGGFATANTPVGIAVRRLKLVSGKPDLLIQVIHQLETTATDSDGDGQGDVAELRAGTNPNAAGSEALGCYTPPPEEDEGGCAIGPGDQSRAAWPMAALLLCAFVVRRRVSSVQKIRA